MTAVTTATASSKAPAQVAATPRPAPAPRYLEQRPPIYFPDCEKVPESDLHLELRTLLYLLLKDTWGHACTVGSDQFLYFDAEDPRQCLAPDAYVGLTPPGRRVNSWKVWERGAPEIAVEILSRSDAPNPKWNDRLNIYRRLGVQELLRFDPLEQDPAKRLRIYNRHQGALVERAVEGDTVPSLILDMDWQLAPGEGLDVALRIAREGVLVPTRLEARDAETAARQAAEARVQAETEARQAAEARVQALEAELARR